jgi:hypothetical protein
MNPACALLAMLFPVTALACPSCASGEAARQAAFGPGFWTSLGLLLSPVAACLLVAAILNASLARSSHDQR